MTKIRNAVMKQITAHYVPVDVNVVSNPSRLKFFYGATQMLLVTVGQKRWALPINKGRANRSSQKALKAILAETKVGKKIMKRAERFMIVERATKQSS